MTKPLLQLTLVLALGLSTAGCDTVSSAADSVGSAISDLNPFGGSDDSAPAQTADAGASSDANATTSPDLANLPPPPSSSTAAQQQAAAQSLAADGAQARYSADNLRAGTESAAPPPTADAPPSAALAAASAAPNASDAPPSAGGGAAPSAAPSTTDVPPSADTAPSAAPSADMPPSATASAPSASPAVAAPPAARQTAAASAAPPPSALTEGTGALPVGPSAAPVRTASLPPPSSVSGAPMPAGAEPAVPAVPSSRAGAARGGAMAMAAQAPSDAALGFQPSSAPPLDPSINQWVAAPIVAHYRQTAANAGVSVASNAAVPARGATAAGSVEAFNNGGVTPTAVVLFPGDGTTLSAAARNQIRSAVTQFRANGGDGSIRVVGHASSRTANMPVEKHLELIFDKSQARANAVAQELIHEGVPAAKVLVEAVGDSQPVYYESMPQGEDGNRRAEIFVQ